MLCYTGLLFFASTFFTCTLAVSVTTCNSITDQLVSIKWLKVQPNPIKLPTGNLPLILTINASATLHQPLSGNLDAELTISRSFGRMWIDLPCISTPMGSLGTCTYTNICGSLMRNGTQCPSLLARNGIPCTCPVPAQTYTIQPTTIRLDLASLNIPTFAAAGDYQASLRVTDKDTMTEIICLDFFVEITMPETSNPFGSIGRFFYNLFG